jgi:hypothetical protein
MIILLNGCINAGKSSVAKALTQLLPQSAHVELDDLRHFMTWMPLNDQVFALTLEAAVAVTRVFAQHGLHVVLTWPMGEYEYDFLLAHLQPLGQPLHTFTLDTELEVLLTNRGGRELTDKERRRIREQYADGRYRPAFGKIVNNTHWTAEQTAQHILILMEDE